MKKIILILAVYLIGCNDVNANACSDIMIGNSYCASFHSRLPSSCRPSIRWIGGADLRQHLNDPISLSAMCASGKTVFIQNHSVSARDNNQFQIDVRDTIQYIKSCNGKPVLVMTWESINVTYEQLQLSYQQASKQNNVPLIEIGTVFNTIRSSNQSLFWSLLDQSDLHHASVKGTYVAAAAFLKQVDQSSYESFDLSSFFTAGDLSIINQALTSMPNVKNNNIQISPIVNFLLLE